MVLDVMHSRLNERCQWATLGRPKIGTLFKSRLSFMFGELEDGIQSRYDSHAFGPFCLKEPSRHCTAVYTDTEYHSLPDPDVSQIHGTHLLPSERDLHLDLTINLEIM